MLAEIRIDSLGAIDTATAEFDRGLTVLTGETGAGKTMVVTGLHLLGGARADASRVRSGAERAVVEGRFGTAELDPATAAQVDEIIAACGAERDDDGSVIALRTVRADGPSRAYLGGRSVPAKSLSALTSGLLTLHGQNDQLRLMRPDQQRAALDRFAAVGEHLENYRKLRDEWLIARRDLTDRTARARELQQEADRLGFALAEIDRIAPVPGEDGTLAAEISRLTELDALREAASGARAALAGGDDPAAGPDSAPRPATEALSRAAQLLASTGDAALGALAEQVSGALRVTADAAAEVAAFLAALPADASGLEARLGRQAELRGLTRKYAADIDGVLSWASQSRSRLASLDVSEETLTGLSTRVGDLATRLATAAGALSAARTAAAARLADAVSAELSGLAMSGARFGVTVTGMPARPEDIAPLKLESGALVHAGADGTDLVEFAFAAHPGTAALPLAKSASGGELSRVMLALEVVLSTSAAGTTMVFDEVDAGVGGRAAVQIGRRLARLARTHQVIVVTHLPQVAAYADTHLSVDNAHGSASVRPLDDAERVAELARMLAGLGESDTGRAHARELLEAARRERAGADSNL
jgi:DNA repair protein RecN (Recombination protein N)